jgi:hypothetical protein
MSTEEAAFSVGRTSRLVNEYEKIIEQYKEKNYVIAALLKSEIGIETRTQITINEGVDKKY